MKLGIASSVSVGIASGVLLGAFACGASLVGHATDGVEPHEHDTDCHDGTWCPPAFPQCPPYTFAGKPRGPCEAAGDPLLAGKEHDAGSVALPVDMPYGWCDMVQGARHQQAPELCPSGKGHIKLLSRSAVECSCADGGSQ